MTMTQATPPVGPPAYGTPGTHQPAPPTEAAGVPGHRGRHRRVLLSVIIGVLALAGGGVAGLMTTRAGMEGAGPVDCGPTQCIPSLSGEAVVAALKERGFACDFSCVLSVGDTRYDAAVRVEESHDLISSYELAVFYDPRLELSPRAMGFLTWFATLPFDEEAREEATAAREWLAEHVGNDQAARIRGYEYRLTAPEAGQVRLVVQAWPDPGNPFDPAAGE
jgi:hypothetical protein